MRFIFGMTKFRRDLSSIPLLLLLLCLVSSFSGCTPKYRETFTEETYHDFDICNIAYDFKLASEPRIYLERDDELVFGLALEVEDADFLEYSAGIMGRYITLLTDEGLSRISTENISSENPGNLCYRVTELIEDHGESVMRVYYIENAKRFALMVRRDSALRKVSSDNVIVELTKDRK